MGIISKYYINQEVIDTPRASTAGDPLTLGISWMPKGIYRFGGVDFDCTHAGLYRFWDQSEAIIHSRLVYAYPGQIEPDLYGFLSGLSWHHMHDSRDEALEGRELAIAGHNHCWRLRCGPTVNLARWFLSGKYRYQTRQINLAILDPRWSVFNGHIVVEIYHDGKWKLWDISNGVIFKKDGIHLNAEEIILQGANNCERIRIDGGGKRGSAAENGWCSRSATDLFILPDAGNAWFKRIYQSFTIQVD